MKKYKFFFISLLLIPMFLFTGAKIIKMLKIREIIEGSNYIKKEITGKWIDNVSDSDSYWISWNNVNIKERSTDRINLPNEEWKKFEIGDTIEITYFKYDIFPYYKNGIYASNGNFIFDLIIICIEVSIFLFLFIKGISSLKLNS